MIYDVGYCISFKNHVFTTSTISDLVLEINTRIYQVNQPFNQTKQTKSNIIANYQSVKYC